MNKTIFHAITASIVALSLPAAAQFARPEDAIKYRQSSMFIIGQNAGRIGAMVQGKVPFDAKVAADSAATMEFMAKLPWGAFAEGTEKGAIASRAKPEIWTDKAKFTELAEKLQLETAKLNVAAKTGNLDNIKAAMGGVGGTCKSCHDAFQAKQ